MTRVDDIPTGHSLKKIKFCSVHEMLFTSNSSLMSHGFPRISEHLGIVSKSLKISSRFSLGIQTHAHDVVYMQ